MREVKYSILHSITITGSLWKSAIQASGQLLDSEQISLRPNVVRDNDVGAASRRQLHFQAQDKDAGIFFTVQQLSRRLDLSLPQRARDCEGVPD